MGRQRIYLVLVVRSVGRDELQALIAQLKDLGVAVEISGGAGARCDAAQEEEHGTRLDT